MGLDPENPDYEVGINNPTCHATLFNGETPKYVEVRVEGMIQCPGFGLPPPNGSLLLQQLIGGVSWSQNIGQIIFTWEISATGSKFLVVQIFGGFPWWYFLSQTVLLCQTTFANQRICGAGRSAASGGTAEIFWGPAIHA